MAHNKPQVTLTNLLPDDNQDVVIRRTTSSTSQLLVLMSTQHQYYIKNEKTGEITPLIINNNLIVTDFTKDNLDETEALMLKNLIRKLKTFIADGVNQIIDAPIHARWLRGIENIAYACEGKLKKAYKERLSFAVKMCTLDYVLNKNNKLYEFVCLKDNAIRKYGLITAYALAGGNAIIPSSDYKGLQFTISNTARYTDSADQLKWLLRHQNFIDMLIDAKLVMMAHRYPYDSNWMHERYDADVFRVGTQYIDDMTNYDRIAFNLSGWFDTVSSKINTVWYPVSSILGDDILEGLVHHTDRPHIDFYLEWILSNSVVVDQISRIHHLLNEETMPGYTGNHLKKTKTWIKHLLDRYHCVIPDADTVYHSTATLMAINPLCTVDIMKGVNNQLNIAGYTVMNLARDYMMMVNDVDQLDDSPHGNTSERWPNNIKEAHDILAKTRKQIETDAYNKRIKDMHDKYAWMETTLTVPTRHINGNATEIAIRAELPTNQQWLIDEGRYMNNCIATYAKQVAKGSSIIVSIKKREETGGDNTDTDNTDNTDSTENTGNTEDTHTYARWIDLELDPEDFHIRQQYRSCNRKLDAEAKHIVDAWLKSVLSN